MEKIFRWMALGKTGLDGISVARRLWHWGRWFRGKQQRKRRIFHKKITKKSAEWMKKSEKTVKLQYKIGKKLFLAAKKRYY